MFTGNLIEMGIRMTLLTAVGLVVAKILECRSATMAHRVLTVNAVFLVLLPLFRCLSPLWECNLPAWLNVSDLGLQPIQPTLAASNSTESTFAIADSADFQAIPTPALWPVSWSDLCFNLGCVVTIVMGLRLTQAIRALRRMILRSHRAPSAICERVLRLANSLGVRSRITVLVSPPDSMPFVCWYNRWILVLPSNIQSWDANSYQATIEHELGHIARRDAWVDYLMRGLACVLWWNPLFWIMQRWSVRLRELACDEWVLHSSSLTSIDYAMSLLAVVKRCQFDRHCLTSPMATRGELESRLRNITSTNPSKFKRSKWLTLVIIAIATLCLGIATMRLVRVPLIKGTKEPARIADGQFEMDDLTPASQGGIRIEGRVTFQGDAVAGIKVKLMKGPSGSEMKKHGVATTDQEGKYQFDGMQVGDHYYLEIQNRGDSYVRNWQYQPPYSHILSQMKGTTLELPDANMVRSSQTLRGVVVDLDGKPLSGLTVNASLATGEMLSPLPDTGVKPWTETDARGRFRLVNLPDEPIELMAYIRKPEDSHIRHPSKIRPIQGDQNIRIVYDPKLGSGIEDLDSKKR